MFSNLTGMHAVVILAIVLLLFGAAKLPALARSLGQSVRILKDEAGDDSSPESAPVTVHEPVREDADDRERRAA